MEKLYVDAQVFPNQVETLMTFGLAKEEEEDKVEAFNLGLPEDEAD